MSEFDMVMHDATTSDDKIVVGIQSWPSEPVTDSARDTLGWTVMLDVATVNASAWLGVDKAALLKELATIDVREDLMQGELFARQRMLLPLNAVPELCSQLMTQWTRAQAIRGGQS